MAINERLLHDLGVFLRYRDDNPWLHELKTTRDLREELSHILRELQGCLKRLRASLRRVATVEESKYQDVWQHYQETQSTIMFCLSCITNLYLFRLLRESTSHVLYIYTGVGHLPHMLLYLCLQDGFRATHYTNDNIPLLLDKTHTYSFKEIVRRKDDFPKFFGWSYIDENIQCSSISDFPVGLL